MNNPIYSKEELYSMEPQRVFKHDAKEAAFLLGGIGTGNISVGARGELRDWEIFNTPAKGNYAPFTFFSIWAKPEGGESITRVLESNLTPPFSKSHGFSCSEIAGLPRLDSSTLKGEYPFVTVDFQDKKLPVNVSLTAFTPFIPLNADDSGIPGAIFRYKVTNPTDKPVNVTVVGTFANMVGFNGYGFFGVPQFVTKAKNDYIEEYECRGLYYHAPELDSNDLKYGTMALLTKDQSTTVKRRWTGSAWWGGDEFWSVLSKDGKLNDAQDSAEDKDDFKVGSLGIYHTLNPGEEKVFEFILTWHFPNRTKGWYGDGKCDCKDGSCVEKNYYANLFKDAWDAGKYMINHMPRLEKGTRDFHNALFNSTLPSHVIDAVASNITVIRSTTCFRVKNGTFFGWEGCFDGGGCCEGSCTHVWNYAQTLAFLFPELEQTMRKVEFNIETDEEGNMAFRTRQALGEERFKFHPATDGQMGTIIRLYREWKLTGDDEFLKCVWENAKRALDFAFTYWDSDGDFVLDSQQHNTYDIEFYGPNSLTNSMFFAALKAAAEMAEYLGDSEYADKYKNAFEKGSKKMDELLWNGEYYIQQIDDPNKYLFQYGNGCLSDQILGQFMAHMAGLGYILPEKHVKKTIYSIFKYNFKDSFKEHPSFQRIYALGDEKGLLLCTWPYGGRPIIPFIYSDEIWTGIEYQVATHLIYEGFVDEGLTIVKAVRDRHDGYRRNPWNEVECGHHYARSLASWGVLTALSGFKYDMVKGTMSFKPVINKDNFKTLWSTGKAWGAYSQKIDPETGERKWNIEVLYGSLEGIVVNEE